MASYLNKEISEWNTKDLTSWLMDNKYPGISELCQNNSLSGYDLFFINDDILKNELGLTSFHERKVTMKLISKLINEHLKLNIINSNGDNVILTLDNNQDTSLGELSEYIGGMFNMEPKDILYKDFSKKEVLSPTLKIIKLMILYPKLYKTLNIFNMKDYHQMNEDNLEQKNNDFNNINDNDNNQSSENEIENENENESDYQEIERANNMNYNYKANRQNNYNEDMNKNNNFDEKNNREKYDDEMNQNRIIYNDDENEKINKIIYNNDYDIKNKKFRSEQRIYRSDKKDNKQNEEIDSDYDDNKNMDNNDLKYRIKTSYKDNNNSKMNKDYYSYRNKKKNLNDRSYQENYNNNKLFKNIDNRDYYSNNNNSSALN